jgi:hypothetical protein
VWVPGPSNPIDRYGGTFAMVDGVVYLLGGGTSRVQKIDLNPLTSNPTAPLNFVEIEPTSIQRTYAVASLAPNGIIALTGGTSDGSTGNVAAGVKYVEFIDTTTGQRYIGPQAADFSGYHGNALALSTGDFVVTGSGENPGGGDPDFTRIQKYRPWYMLGATRPRLSLSVPAVLRYGQTLTFNCPDAKTVTRFSLNGYPAATHAVNFSQRLDWLKYSPSADGQSLIVQAPTGPNKVPPGTYYVCAVRGLVTSLPIKVRVTK